VEQVAQAARSAGAALLAVPVRDTLHRARDGRALEVVARADLWAAQTPQGFRRAEFVDACARAAREGRRFTDDAALWEHYVGPVQLVEGSPDNLKLTTPEDLITARALLAAREDKA
jgi:2-C-methyl-D-erythritol 4-phosphate cytidylyltransferase